MDSNQSLDANTKAPTVVRVSKRSRGSGSLDPLPRAAVFFLVFKGRKPLVVGEGKEWSRGPRIVSVVGISGSIKYRIYRGDGKAPLWDILTGGSSIDTCATTILSTFPNLCPPQHNTQNTTKSDRK